jgi:hypothetical protein
LDFLAVLRTMALPPVFARAVDKLVATRMRTYATAQTVNASALGERLRHVNQMYELGRIDRAEYDEKCREVGDQRSRSSRRPCRCSGSSNRS